jgi:hypothetical protein
MSHTFKSGSSVFISGSSIITVNDSITNSKQPINIGLNNTQAIEFDTAAQRYYVANSGTVKVYDSNFVLIDTITSISGIVSMQLDSVNNRLIVTEKNSPSFKAINLNNLSITTIFTITNVTEQVRVGYFDQGTNKFYIGTNQVYVFSNTGSLIGMITDSRLQSSTITNIIKNPHTGLLMISIINMILLADPILLSVQSNSITGPGVGAPGFIRFDPVNPNSYWLCNPANTTVSEMSIGTNAAKRIINLGNSTPYCVWVENSIGLYSLIITDAGWNQFYRLKERLV